jgi:hypothetical protein
VRLGTAASEGVARASGPLGMPNDQAAQPACPLFRRCRVAEVQIQGAVRPDQELHVVQRLERSMCVAGRRIEELPGACLDISVAQAPLEDVDPVIGGRVVGPRFQIALRMPRQRRRRSVGRVAVQQLANLPSGKLGVVAGSHSTAEVSTCTGAGTSADGSVAVTAWPERQPDHDHPTKTKRAGGRMTATPR